MRRIDNPEEMPKKLKKIAWFLYRENRFEECVQVLSRMIETLGSQDRAVYHKRGKAYFRQLDYDKAIEDFTTAIEICPHAHSFARRAFVYLILQKFEEAIVDANEAIKLDPKYVRAHLWLANANLLLKNVAETEQSFDEVVRLRPRHDPFPYYARGMGFIQLGLVRKAISNFEHALVLAQECLSTENMVYALVGHAFAMQQLQQYDKVIQLLEEADQLDSGNPLVWFCRAETNFRRKQYAAAIEDFDSVISFVDDRNAGRFPNCVPGCIGIRLCEYSAANSAADPELVTSVFNRGQCHLVQKLYDLALDDFRRCVRYDPFNYNAQRSLGLACVHKKSHEEAHNAYTNAIRIGSTWKVNVLDTIYLERGRAQLGAGNFLGAQEDIAAAIGLVEGAAAFEETPLDDRQRRVLKFSLVVQALLASHHRKWTFAWEAFTRASRVEPQGLRKTLEHILRDHGILLPAVMAGLQHWDDGEMLNEIRKEAIKARRRARREKKRKKKMMLVEEEDEFEGEQK